MITLLFESILRNSKKLEGQEEIGDGSLVIARIHSRPHIQELQLISWE